MIELPLPARVERRVIATARGPVPVLVGAPDPDVDTGIDVVMVSGFFGTKEDFRELISLFAQAGLRGWSYDYTGQLDPEHEADEFTIARMADELRDVMDAATGGRPAHIIGHCLGGFVARSAILADPDRALSLTLLGCGPSMNGNKHKAMLDGLAQLHSNGGTIALWPLVKVLIAADDTVMRAFWHEKLSTMNQRWVTGTAESMAEEPDRSAEITAAGIPSIVLHGKRDKRVWSHDEYADMASRLGADRVIIERASHSPNMEQPQRVASVLLEFFSVDQGEEREAVAG
jgi:pimeloyl-ACP methyl ester carboxylesterase